MATTKEAANCGQRANIIVAVHVLPVKLHQENDSWKFIQDENASMYHFCRMILENHEVYVVGFIDELEEVSGEVQRFISDQLFSDYKYIPLFMSKKNHIDIKNEFMDKQLWPILHGVPLCSPNDDRSISDGWSSNIFTNDEYAGKILNLKNTKSIIWIVGYKLMLLPNLIRKGCIASKIIFSVQTPFPVAETFQSIAYTEELLGGILGADVVGFCSTDHAYNFLCACEKFLGLDYKFNEGIMKLEYAGRAIIIKILPVMITSTRHVRHKTDKFQQLKAMVGKNTVFLGIDHLCVYSGIKLKLHAMELLLEKRVPAVLLQLVIVNTNSSSTLRCSLKKLASKINHSCHNKYSSKPVMILFYEKNVDEEERVVYYRLADCLVITAIRDMINAFPFEYVMFGEKVDLILSEQLTATDYLHGVVKVNPCNVHQIKDAMLAKIRRPASDLDRQRNLEYVIGNQKKLLCNVLQDISHKASKNSSDGCGFGLNRRSVLHDDNFKRICGSDLSSAFKASKERLILIDYDGQLNAISSEDPLADRLIVSLTKLSPYSKIIILSKLGEAELPSWITMFLGLDIVIEDGFVRRASIEDEGTELEGFDDLEWMDDVRAVLNPYLENIVGSSLTVNRSSLVVHFRGMKRQLVALLVDDLVRHALSMVPLFADGNLCINHGKDNLRIKHKEVTKAAAMLRILNGMKAEGRQPDFVLYMGFDSLDQELVETIQQFIPTTTSETIKTVHAVQVGLHSTEEGGSYVCDTEDAVEILKELANIELGPRSRSRRG